MITQNEIKHIQSLQQKKFRNLHKQFIAEGPKLVEELISSKYSFEKIYAKKEWLSAHSDKILKRKIPFAEANDKEMERISGLTQPNNVLAVLHIPEEAVPAGILTKDITLVLDEIKDPGNLGTIIRTADWFGIKNIVCSENSVEVYNPKVVQATMGSIARVNVYYTDLVTFLKENKEKISIYGAFTDGEDVSRVKSNGQGMIVIGNESFGISKELEPFIHHRISIPTFRAAGEKGPESLNASVAAAIICYAFRKKN